MSHRRPKTRRPLNDEPNEGAAIRECPPAHLEDLEPPLHVGQVDRHTSVEAAGTGERAVEDISAVGRGEDDDARVAIEAVLYKRRPPTIVGLAGASIRSSGRRRAISVRIWLSVCSRSSLPPPERGPLAPPARAPPMASTSSMKTMHGAFFLAWLG